MAKTFKNFTPESSSRDSKKSNSHAKRSNKRFQGIIGSIRNVDPSNLIGFELDDIAGEARVSVRY